MKRRSVAIVAAAAFPLLLVGTGLPAAGTGLANAEPPEQPQPAAVRTAKGEPRPTVTHDGKKYAAPNPYLALVPEPAEIDWSYWRSQAKAQSAAKAAARSSAAAVPVPVQYDEQEPVGTFGENDTQSDAEPLNGFGTGRSRNPAIQVNGDLAEIPFTTAPITTSEENGAIPFATDTGIGDTTDAVTTSSVIGDGLYGSAGLDTGDFDFFAFTATAGQLLDANTAGSDFDTVLELYDEDGNFIAFDDDGGGDLTSHLRFAIPADGSYYLMVGGFGTFPEDPFDPASGIGAGDEGDYDVEIIVNESDIDFYAVNLKAGDVIGGSLSGGATNVRMWRYDGVEAVGSTQDASFIYPSVSPLPGGGNAVFAYVAEEPGWYAVSVSLGSGPYELLLEAYRPGTQGERVAQTIYLDFDGARLNTNIFGGPGVRTLSPLSSFLAGWGLPASAEDAVIDAIIAEVRENIRQDLIDYGLNDQVAVKILNSRDNRDQFGRENISRVIVGGTIEESGIPTIGVAQSIDPGNFGTEETALVLLDILSGPVAEWGDASLNYYLTPASDKIGFIGQAVGNVVSHEVGHYVGSFHVDQFNDILNLMDQGGNFPLLYGVGPDGVGGTADDPDVDFAEDIYNPNEGFTGLEDTLNNTAWGFSRSRR